MIIPNIWKVIKFMFQPTRYFVWDSLQRKMRDVIRREVCRVGFDQRNPKPETRNRLWRLNFPRTDRNPKPETRNRLWRLKFLRADRNPKPENRNPKPTAKVGFNRRNPKPETDSESGFQATKPETRNRQRKLVSIDETRNPKPTAKVGFKRRNPKPKTRNPKPTAKVGFNRRNPKPETRNPKPTRIRLLGGSPDRNSKMTSICESQPSTPTSTDPDGNWTREAIHLLTGYRQQPSF